MLTKFFQIFKGYENSLEAILSFLKKKKLNLSNVCYINVSVHENLPFGAQDQC